MDQRRDSTHPIFTRGIDDDKWRSDVDRSLFRGPSVAGDLNDLKAADAELLKPLTVPDNATPDARHQAIDAVLAVATRVQNSLEVIEADLRWISSVPSVSAQSPLGVDMILVASSLSSEQQKSVVAWISNVGGTSALAPTANGALAAQGADLQALKDYAEAVRSVRDTGQLGQRLAPGASRLPTALSVLLAGVYANQRDMVKAGTECYSFYDTNSL